MVKNQTVDVDRLQLSKTKTRGFFAMMSVFWSSRDATTKNDIISKKLIHCIFIFWVNTQNSTG